MPINREDVGIAIRSALLSKVTQQKFSLIVLVIISILFLYIDTFQNKPLNTARAVIKDLIYRGSILVSMPGKGMNSSLSTIKTHLNVRSENIKLKKEINSLKESIDETNFLNLENKQLKLLLDQEIASDSYLKNAKVVIDKNSPFLKSIILDKGSNENLKKGMAVLDGKNFIGRIVEVNFFSSRVLLVTDLNSKIPVIIEPEGYQAILSGINKDKPILEYLPKNHKIVEGNTIYTSGKDGIFSSGIPIGKTLIADNEVKVSLFSNLSQLSYVNIDLGKLNIEESIND